MPRRPTPPDPDERERIILATLSVIADTGINSAKLATIAERAGIAYGTLYRHFDDRDALLLAAMTHQAEVIKHDWERELVEGDVIDRLIELSTAPIRRSAADPHSRELYGATLLAGSKVVPHAADLVRSMGDIALQRTTSTINEAKTLGYFHGLDTDFLAVTILGVNHAYLSTNYLTEEPDWPRVITEFESLIRKLAGTPRRRTPARPRDPA